MASRLKRSNCPEWFFPRKLIKLLILQNFKKILRANPELWECAIFEPKMTHLTWTKFFGYKLLLLLSPAYWPFSLCKSFKKFFQRIQSLEDAQFLGQKWSISPNKNFFKKPVNEPCFFNSCLSTYMPKIKVRYLSASEILAVKEYWNLIGREPF